MRFGKAIDSWRKLTISIARRKYLRCGNWNDLPSTATGWIARECMSCNPQTIFDMQDTRRRPSRPFDGRTFLPIVHITIQ